MIDIIDNNFEHLIKTFFQHYVRISDKDIDWACRPENQNIAKQNCITDFIELINMDFEEKLMLSINLVKNYLGDLSGKQNLDAAKKLVNEFTSIINSLHPYFSSEMCRRMTGTTFIPSHLILIKQMEFEIYCIVKEKRYLSKEVRDIYFNYFHNVVNLSRLGINFYYETPILGDVRKSQLYNFMYVIDNIHSNDDDYEDDEEFEDEEYEDKISPIDHLIYELDLTRRFLYMYSLKMLNKYDAWKYNAIELFLNIHDEEMKLKLIETGPEYYSNYDGEQSSYIMDYFNTAEVDSDISSLCRYLGNNPIEQTDNEIPDLINSIRKNEDLFDLIKTNLYIIDCFEQLIYIFVRFIVNNHLKLKVCNNCQKLFVADRNNQSYCNNIIEPNSNKTCREIGAKIVYNYK